MLSAPAGYDAGVTAANPRPTSPGQRGGLNFWQWLGIAIIVIGALAYLWRNLGSEEPTPPRQQPEQEAPVQAENAQTAPAQTETVE